MNFFVSLLFARKTAVTFGVFLASAGLLGAETKAETAPEKSAAGAAKSPEFKPDVRIVYKTVGDVTLRLHVFNPPGHHSGDQTPAVVFFFGGGFNIGKASQFYNECHYLASRGMVAIAADYRTKTAHGTPPEDCVKDAKSALRWVRAHAKELGIDPGRLAAGGSSAGGFLAAATATLPGYNEEGEDTSVSCRPDALVVYYGNFDGGPGNTGKNDFAEGLRRKGPQFLPINYVANPFPPTIYLVGTEDHLVPPAAAQKIKATIESVGGRCDLHSYEGQAHSFSNKGEYVGLTLTEVDKFFASLGWLKGEPNVPR